MKVVYQVPRPEEKHSCALPDITNNTMRMKYRTGDVLECPQCKQRWIRTKYTYAGPWEKLTLFDLAFWKLYFKIGK